MIRDGWRNEHVKESLDLCLACKGCKSDCPVAVDVATYKAEFLSHYYESHLRPAKRVRVRKYRHLGTAGFERAGLGESDHAAAVPA